jgi:hypothetical protein
VTATADQPAADAGAPGYDPLDLARNAAHNVRVLAELQDRDPVGSHINQAGSRGFAAAQLGACMAAVSAAQDIRRAADAAERMAADVHVIAEHFRWGQ